MKILIDGDAFPNIKEIINLAKKYNCEVCIFIDTNHLIEDTYAKIVMVSEGNNSVDIMLENSISLGDLVLTQDYGVAMIALLKGAICINQYGIKYTDYNIDYLMEIKTMNLKYRKHHLSKGLKKRSRKDRENLLNQIERIIKR